MVNLAEKTLVREEAALAALVVVTTLTVKIEYGKGEKFYRGNRSMTVRESVDVEVSINDCYKSEHSDYVFQSAKNFIDPEGGSHRLDFHEIKKSRVYGVERNIKALKEDIKFFKAKIAEFVEKEF
jgi:hypothetical protein